MIAFKADNPGNWLMHCHIAAHASFGLGAQILERQADANAIWPHPSDGPIDYCGKNQRSSAKHGITTAAIGGQRRGRIPAQARQIHGTSCLILVFEARSRFSPERTI
jgi:hypothetical protein